MTISRQITAVFFAGALVLGISGCGIFEPKDASKATPELQMFQVQDKQKNDKNSVDSQKVVDPDAEFDSENGGKAGQWGNENPNSSDKLPLGKRIIPGVMFEPVYFKFDQHRIDSEQTAKLDTVLSYLKGHPDAGVIIEGYCDNTGSEEYNRSLGERRAIAGRDYLLENGISEKRIATVSYGEEKPVDGVDQSNEDGKAKNRRDEFIAVEL